MKEATLEFMTDALLVALSANLLYLYFNGGWVEANTIILVVELALLVLIIGLAIYRCYHFLTKRSQ